MPKESLPLGAGYLKASLVGDPDLESEVEVSIANFRGGVSVEEMAQRLYGGEAPDIVAFSVFGWNFQPFGHLAETFKMLNPEGWVIFGGVHVANQAERVFRLFPAVDVVANEEGERTFPAFVRAFLASPSNESLAAVPGISFRQDGAIRTTEAGGRISDLGAIHSPFLTGALPLTDAAGRFRYDIALLETNRGCPYRCSFCYWGGAIGQRIREFPRERLREELDLFGFHQVETVMLCDANFGMRRADADFVEDLIRTRERWGYPRAIETAWAKNKSQVFFDIVRRMKDEGLHGSFTLALQTLSEPALEAMRRRNMQLNEWKQLVAWLEQTDLDCYVELIWGTPGDTVESFLSGYDELSECVSRIAVYPLLLLPNTGYVEDRDKHGFVTVRGERDDFEYVLAHRTMSMAENAAMQTFMFWARTMAENSYFRWIWAPLRLLAGLSQSEVIRSMASWFSASSHPSAGRLLATQQSVANSQVVAAAMRVLYTDPGLAGLFSAWWDECIRPRVDAEHASFLDEVFRYDCLTRPVFDDGATGPFSTDLELADEGHLVRRGVELRYPVRSAVHSMRKGDAVVPRAEPTCVDLYYRRGFHEHIDNQEVALNFAADERPALRHTGVSAAIGSSR